MKKLFHPWQTQFSVSMTMVLFAAAATNPECGFESTDNSRVVDCKLVVHALTVSNSIIEKGVVSVLPR
jgi:hypothetical protein